MNWLGIDIPLVVYVELKDMDGDFCSCRACRTTQRPKTRRKRTRCLVSQLTLLAVPPQASAAPALCTPHATTPDQSMYYGTVCRSQSVVVGTLASVHRTPRKSGDFYSVSDLFTFHFSVSSDTEGPFLKKNPSEIFQKKRGYGGQAPPVV